MKNKIKFILYILSLIQLTINLYPIKLENNNLPKWQLKFDIPIQFNPIGISFETTLKRNFRLYNSNQKIFKNNKLSVGLINKTTPVETQGGAILEFKPADFFDIDFQYAYLWIWRSLRFNSLGESTDSKILKEKRLNDYLNETGVYFHIRPKIFLAYNNIYLINIFTYYYMDVENGDNIFYNNMYSHLQKSGFNWKLDSNLLYKFDKNYIGLNSATTYASDSDYQRTNITIMYMAENIDLMSKNDILIIRFGKWLNDRFRKKDYLSIYGLIYYSVTFDL